MVRTRALIFIISFLAGCAGSEAPPPESPSVSAPLGATLVIPGKGLDALSDWAERALGERLPESTLVPFEGDDTLSGGGIQWGSAFATSFENTLIDLGFPQDNGAIPVEIELPFLELPYTTVDPEGNPCEGLLRFPSPRLAFELKGSLTRSGTTAFAALGSTLTTGTPEWVDCPPDEEIWSEPVLAVLDTDWVL